MTARFELTPLRSRTDWEFALAFAFVPALGLFLTLHATDHGWLLPTCAAAGVFIAILLVSLGAGKARPGRATLDQHHLSLDWEGVRYQVPLSEIVEISPRTSESPFAAGMAVATFGAMGEGSVVLKTTSGQRVQFTPVHGAAFSRALENARRSFPAQQAIP